MSSEALDTGTGYARKAPTYNAGLTEVGRGKPMVSATASMKRRLETNSPSVRL